MSWSSRTLLIVLGTAVFLVALYLGRGNDFTDEALSLCAVVCSMAGIALVILSIHTTHTSL